MKTLKLVLIITLLFFVSNVYAGNITIYDKMSLSPDPTGGWYGNREDNEVEPNMAHTQIWDLEAFVTTGGMKLTMVGGWNFQGSVEGFTSGDIFFDSTGKNAKWGSDAPVVPGGSLVQNVWGYDYVIDMDWTNGNYIVYKIDASTILQTITFYTGNTGSNPYKYSSGAVEQVGSGTASFETFSSNITPYGTFNGAYGNNTHYAVTINDSYFGNKYIVHFTEQCGNDDLIGKVPEPATIILLGCGLLGLALYRRK